MESVIAEFTKIQNNPTLVADLWVKIITENNFSILEIHKICQAIPKGICENHEVWRNVFLRSVEDATPEEWYKNAETMPKQYMRLISIIISRENGFRFRKAKGDTTLYLNRERFILQMSMDPPDEEEWYKENLEKYRRELIRRGRDPEDEDFQDELDDYVYSIYRETYMDEAGGPETQYKDVPVTDIQDKLTQFVFGLYLKKELTYVQLIYVLLDNVNWIPTERLTDILEDCRVCGSISSFKCNLCEQIVCTSDCLNKHNCK